MNRHSRDEAGPSARGLVPGMLVYLLPDVSLRTTTGLAALAVAALIGAAISLAGFWMTASPRNTPFFAYIVSLCRTSLGAQSREGAFLAENRTAMTTMMAGMDIGATGDVDRDFASTMVPHHQGAIDMARAFLRYGHNEKIRRLAQEIIVTQQQEIAVMRLAVEPPPLSMLRAEVPLANSN